ncbi:MAG TPA: L,D-transpeptidase, partial [Candidatus Kapabacteria bacterium]|nr:L,D-transpeptidase [Candidatus Kapabacteria bacterium]
MHNTPFYKNLKLSLVAILLLLTAAGCAEKTSEDAELSESEKQTIPASTSDRSITQDQYGITLPLLDAFFADSSFKTDIKREVGLTDDEVLKLQQMAREETAKIQDISGDDYTRTTTAAQQLAEQRIAAIIGNEKGAKLASYLNRRWSGSMVDASTGSGPDSNAPSGTMNSVPTDTRVVVNAPAHRMDIFNNGQLVKSYTIAIGVPEFPLPVGMRKANEIIFNPTWTPPDESWVDSSKKYTVGKKVEAGSKLNPLGVLKVPIGLPSLIHGGKSEAQLGTFGSHGCVGLTNTQAIKFSQQLAALGSDSLDDKEITAITKNKKETKSIKLTNAVPIELRYETIVAQDSGLYIYRDVYSRGTNTEENVRRVLDQHGVKYDQLSDTERTQISDAIRAMSGLTDSVAMASSSDTAKKSTASAKTGKSTAAAKSAKSAQSKKMRVIKIASLAGKGYPSP